MSPEFQARQAAASRRMEPAENARAASSSSVVKVQSSRTSDVIQPRRRDRVHETIATPAGPMPWPAASSKVAAPALQPIRPAAHSSSQERSVRHAKLAGFESCSLEQVMSGATRELTPDDLMDAARSLLEEAAHEILAPLAVAQQLIGAACDPMMDTLVGDSMQSNWSSSERRKLLQIAQGRMEQASLWAENILSSRRLRSPRPLGVRQRFFPDQWKRRAQPLIDRIAGGHGVSVQWIGWERSLPKLYLPSDHLTRVVTNLVVNAAAACTRGQSVSVRVAWQTSVTQSLVIAVEDHGVGAPDDVISFLNGPESAAMRPQLRMRNGIGLQMVKQLVHGMGGTIHARRTGNEGTNQSGTIIRVALPVDDRMTLVRLFLERQMSSSRIGMNETSTPTADRRDRASFEGSQAPMLHLYMIGHTPQSMFDSSAAANLALHEIADPEDFIYRVDRGRWLWLTTATELPMELTLTPWRSALAAKWVWPKTVIDPIPSGITPPLRAAALAKFARSIADTMDLMLNRHVPPLDDLSGEHVSHRMLRDDAPHSMQKQIRQSGLIRSSDHGDASTGVSARQPHAPRLRQPQRNGATKA